MYALCIWRCEPATFCPEVMRHIHFLMHPSIHKHDRHSTGLLTPSTADRRVERGSSQSLHAHPVV